MQAGDKQAAAPKYGVQCSETLSTCCVVVPPVVLLSLPPSLPPFCSAQGQGGAVPRQDPQRGHARMPVVAAHA